MSDTPRTDKAWKAYQEDATCEAGDPWGLASSLERELAAAQRERDEARDQAVAYRDCLCC